MRYVVCYDICDPKRQKKISGFLRRYGERMEESVFECELEERVYTDMCSGLEGLLSDGDKLLIYVLPGNAVRQALYSVSGDKKAQKTRKKDRASSKTA